MGDEGLGRNGPTLIEKARNELMSHVIRCDVLEAHPDDRTEWMDETIDYMAGRYPQLNDIQLTRLEMIGRQFVKPVIPHGAGNTALNRESVDRKAA